MQKRFAVTIPVTVAVLLAGCGGSAPTTTVHPATSPATSVGPSPSVSVPTKFADHDTPINSAPAALRGAWIPYQVRTIPSGHIFDTMPAAPAVGNPNSGVPTAVAASIATAVYREGVLEQWADQRGEAVLKTFLMSDRLRQTPLDAAMTQGAHLKAPNCYFFPTSIVAYPMDDSDRRFFSGIQQPTTAPYLLAEQFAPCSVTAIYADGHIATVATFAGDTPVLTAGMLKQDAVLGPIWYQDSSGLCSTPGRPAVPCGR